MRKKTLTLGLMLTAALTLLLPAVGSAQTITVVPIRPSRALLLQNQARAESIWAEQDRAKAEAIERIESKLWHKTDGKTFTAKFKFLRAGYAHFDQDGEDVQWHYGSLTTEDRKDIQNTLHPKRLPPVKTPVKASTAKKPAAPAKLKTK